MWNVEYDNDTGPGDEGFWQRWTVTNGKRSFDCDNLVDAEWLRDHLNSTT